MQFLCAMHEWPQRTATNKQRDVEVHVVGFDHVF